MIPDDSPESASAATSPSPRALPLSGVTVLDLGQIYNGPYASFLMAMSGARVIKIEPPGGENMRRRGAVGGGAMLPFAMLNSNKEFVTLNLKSAAGCELFLKMIRKADILIENFAPGVMDRLGVGPTRLLQENPRLVYAAGSGYGWTGPYRNFLAMDLTVQAMSGVMACTGFKDSPPVKSGAALCDFFGAVHLYGAAVSALFDAYRTGVGRFVEVSMLEAVYPALSSPLSLYQGLGKKNPPRTGNRHNGLAESPYNVYPTSDGWIALFCVTEPHFAGLAQAMERPDLPGDERFTTYSLPCFPPPTTSSLPGSNTGPEEPRSISRASALSRSTFAGANHSTFFRSGLNLTRLLPNCFPGSKAPLPVIT